MRYPLVSVIIPTTNRPLLLERAITSAISAGPKRGVEVLVIPNGPDQSWKIGMKRYQKQKNVKFFPIKELNANSARNYGLYNAKGKYVRFLDDDDFLLPENAEKQYDLMDSIKVDVISGSIQLIDDKNRKLSIWRQPDTDDFCASILGPFRVCLVHSHVYRKSKIEQLKWDKNTFIRQDFEWLFKLCSTTEIRWHKISDVVGVYQQHRGARVSTSKRRNILEKVTVKFLLEAYQKLEYSGRLNEIRKRSISQGLWGCIHSAFFLEPPFWVRVAKIAKYIDPQARPVHKIYQLPIIRKFKPIMIPWILLPKRYLFYFLTLLSKIGFQ